MLLAIGGHCIVVALGIDTTGTKHPLGLWEGATENATVCQGLLTNLRVARLRTDRSLLVIVDGAKALETAVTQTFGRAAVVSGFESWIPEARTWLAAASEKASTKPCSVLAAPVGYAKWSGRLSRRRRSAGESMPALVAALRARDARLGLGIVSDGRVREPSRLTTKKVAIPRKQLIELADLAETVCLL